MAEKRQEKYRQEYQQGQIAEEEEQGVMEEGNVGLPLEKKDQRGGLRRSLYFFPSIKPLQEGEEGQEEGRPKRGGHTQEEGEGKGEKVRTYYTWGHGYYGSMEEEEEEQRRRSRSTLPRSSSLSPRLPHHAMDTSPYHHPFYYQQSDFLPSTHDDDDAKVYSGRRRRSSSYQGHGAGRTTNQGMIP